MSPPLASAGKNLGRCRQPSRRSCRSRSITCPSRRCIKSAQRRHVRLVRAQNQNALRRHAFALQRLRDRQQRRAASSRSLVTNHELRAPRQNPRNHQPLRHTEITPAIIRMTGRPRRDALNLKSKLSQLRADDCAQRGPDTTNSNDNRSRLLQPGPLNQIGVIQRMKRIVRKSFRNADAHRAHISNLPKDALTLTRQRDGVRELARCIAAHCRIGEH